MTATNITPSDRGRKIELRRAEQLLREGRSQREVAELMGVSQPAISQAISRGEIHFENKRFAKGKAVPWTVAPQHKDQHLVRMLRVRHRKDQGLTSAGPLERMYATFIRQMEKDDAVVTYDPETPDGFYRVRRRPGVDDHPLIRRDDLSDRGRPVKGTASIRRWFEEQGL